MADGAAGFKYDYFISRAGADAAVAQEVADALRDAGHTVRYQDEDIPLGANFVDRMDEFLGQCRHFVLLLSPAYLASPYTRTEWTAFFSSKVGADPSRRLAILRLEACEPPPLLRQYVREGLAGITDPAERRRRILAAAEGRAMREDTRPPIFGNVPARNPAFTGREELLAELHGKLASGSAHTTALTQAIAGLGGVGKTQTAVEYAHRFQADYWGVWWIVGDSRTALEQGLAGLGAKIEPKYAEARTADAAAFALEHIAKGAPKPWLLVFDNVERPDDLAGLRPHANAHVLITSRWNDWGGVADSLGVRVLSPEAAVELLLKRAPKHTDADGAAALAKDLGYLPLALEVAAAFCNRTGTAFATYRLLIADTLKDGAVAATFGPAIERAAQESPHAERLLQLLAFMAPEKIPLEIVTDDVMSALERAEAVAALTSVSLIEVAPEASGPGLADVHRLVQAVVQGRMSAEDREAGAALAVRLVADVFPGTNPGPSDVRSWPACARLLPHALATIETGPQTGEASEPTARLAHQCGTYFYGRADYAAAEQMMRRALAIDEAAYGPDHPDVAIRLSNLAQLLQATGRLAEAEAPMRRALEIDEAAHGGDHPTVAIRLNNLAALLHDTGRLREAEEPMRRVVEIFAKSLGADHPNVATALNNLAQSLQDTGRLREAEEPMRRALAIDEAAYGPNHPEVATDLNNLATLFHATGRLREAEEPMRRALAIWERSLGSDHPNAQTGRRNLAGLEAALVSASQDAAGTQRVPSGDPGPSPVAAVEGPGSSQPVPAGPSARPGTQGGEAATLAEAATAPLHGGSPPRRRWGLLFVLLALIAGMGLAILAALLDPDRLRALLAG